MNKTEANQVMAAQAIIRELLIGIESLEMDCDGDIYIGLQDAIEILRNIDKGE